MRAKAGPAVPVGMAYPIDGEPPIDSGRCWDQRSKLFRWPGAPTGCENAGWRQEVPKVKLARGPEGGGEGPEDLASSEGSHKARDGRGNQLPP